MDKKEREEKLQGYVKRLSEGEDLEAVRKDFVENFQDVDPAEIMHAEQDLMASGVSYKDVQKLCDVHSALFHGRTQQEKIANAEAAVNASLQNARQSAENTGDTAAGNSGVEKSVLAEGGRPVNSGAQAAGPDKMGAGADPGRIAGMMAMAGAAGSVNGKAMKGQAVSKVTFLAMQTGHPVNIFTKENEAIGKKIGEIQAVLQDESKDLQTVKAKFEEIRPISIHYAKKGDLLYPLLKSRYGISGPSDVMWGVDDEIRDEIRALSKDGKDNLTEENWRERAGKVLTRAQEMIYKEQNILLPICAQTFSDTEWKQMARDIQDYDPCLTQRIPLWREAEDAPMWAESPELAQKKDVSQPEAGAQSGEASGLDAGEQSGKTSQPEAASQNAIESQPEADAQSRTASRPQSGAQARSRMAAQPESVVDAPEQLGSAGSVHDTQAAGEGATAGGSAAAALAAAQAALEAAKAALAAAAVQTSPASASSANGSQPAAGQDKETDNLAALPDEIVLPTGHFTKDQLRWVLNTVPLEISFVDDKDINRYFNEGEKYFKRPLQALDREVYYCHPKKVEPMVRMMISQFREGTRKSFSVWMEKMGHTFLVRYLAVYDDKGKFIGTMECVENMDEAKAHFDKNSSGFSQEQKPEW